VSDEFIEYILLRHQVEYVCVCVFGKDIFYGVCFNSRRFCSMKIEESRWGLFVHVITLLVNKISMLKGLRGIRGVWRVRNISVVAHMKPNEVI
jgi:hypothetical protein